MAAPDNRKQEQMLLNLSKVLLIDLTEKENLTGVIGFARFL